MSFRIQNETTRLSVRIENDSRTGQQVIEALHSCRAVSWWSCPSGECAKIGSCESHRDDGAVILAMTPREGETLSASGITECMSYVLGTDVTVQPHGRKL